ncbi:reverse transcriptase [Phytophthora cinnamomi]|uniref:reverse transcriptase n=1 Tax=Phytophthora cinnamomi TaxID=4785 RepID=UPI003559CE6B|nr:reverse transcriptase [Phytophthora cinnamomi]
MNVVADALSRRPDYAEAVDVNAIDAMRSSKPTSSLLDDVKAAYAHDADEKLVLAYGTAPSDKSRQKLPKHLRARAHRFRVHDGLLLYNAVDDNADRVVVPNDHDLRLRIMYEYHDAPTAGHLGREKTYVLLMRDFYWHHQYKWVRKYIRACEDIGSGGDQCGLFKTMAEEKNASVKDVVLEMVNDDSKKCGNTPADGTIPSNGMVKWLGNGGGGFTHVGPCEIYLDDTMMLHGDNYEDEYPGGDVGTTVTSDMPVDYSSCNGDCTLTIYWLAFQNEQWQVYSKLCVV